jgi:SpoVK/Ycf46/Vps4 family AAA+-type ATPase
MHNSLSLQAVASDAQKQIVSSLLSLMDGGGGVSGSGSSNGGVFVLATSSKPNDIDKAFRRPGRFDKEIELPVPSAAERLDILTKLLDRMGVSVSAEQRDEGGPGAVSGEHVPLTSAHVAAAARSAHG